MQIQARQASRELDSRVLFVHVKSVLQATIRVIYERQEHHVVSSNSEHFQGQGHQRVGNARSWYAVQGPSHQFFGVINEVRILSKSSPPFGAVVINTEHSCALDLSFDNINTAY